ncbi:conserved protein, unknown function [Hepatocystis sp. ex Piliocolobus tephrosceles]|nr:conserved protein, unknown function [Hepatocystis sp. ex Piliocolobus tephrosceles]
MSTVTARKDYNDYKLCINSNRYSKNAKEICSDKLNKAVDTTTQIVSRECIANTEDLYKCFKHSFRLSFCDKDVVAKLQSCHSNIIKSITF